MKNKKTEPAPTLAEIYALRILSSLPPKQAGLYSFQVGESCRLLEQEARLSTKEETYKNLEDLIKGSLSEVDLIFGLALNTDCNSCSPAIYAVEPRNSLSSFPISEKARVLLEIVLQYVEKNGPPKDEAPG